MLFILFFVFVRFLALLKRATEDIKIGPPLAPDVKLGPVVSKPQYEKVSAMNCTQKSGTFNKPID